MDSWFGKNETAAITVTRTVDSILAPYKKLIDTLGVHKETKLAEIQKSDAEIAKHEALKVTAQAEADRAHTVAENLKKAFEIA